MKIKIMIIPTLVSLLKLSGLRLLGTHNDPKSLACSHREHRPKEFDS